jgi:hypothetical protein
MRSGRTASSRNDSGVLCPTQAASIQGAFDKPRVDRLYDVESARAALDRQSQRLQSLVLGSADFGVLHRLHVELDQFEADGADGTASRQAAYPGQDVADARLQRRWQPAWLLVGIEYKDL